MPLTNKRIAFVEHYLACWNASEAARRAGYAHRSEGPRLLSNADVQAYVKLRLADIQMTADEVMQRLADHARDDSKGVSLKALELIGKHHKLFTERHEVEATHTVSDDVLDAIGGALKRGYDNEETDDAID